MRFVALACGVLCLALLSGCSSSRITTEIRPDGSWVRTDVFTGPGTKEAGQMGSALDDVFAVPAGPSWKASEERKGDNRVVTASRTLAAGDHLSGDVSLKGGKPGELKMVNEARITRAGPHRFEYRETLHWTSARPDLISVKPEDIAAILHRADAPTGRLKTFSARVPNRQGQVPNDGMIQPALNA